MKMSSLNNLKMILESSIKGKEVNRVLSESVKER
jgi:hypothetical protein